MPRFTSRKGRLALILGLAAALALPIVGVAVAGESQPASSGWNPKQVFVEKLAGILGVDQAKLEAASKEAGKQTVDEALAQGKLTEQQAAALKERIDKGGVWFPGKAAPPGRGQRHSPGRPGTLAPGAFSPANLAEALGLTPDELKSSLQAGQTPAEIAAAKGLTLDQVKETVIGKVKANLDQAVASGKITQQQADSILARAEKMDLNMNRALPRTARPKTGFQRADRND